jgi:D-glycero-alpha-D-manno-heptose-7-phosphate kinase
MIVTRAPLRISFVGGGSDLPDFYHLYPGQVISATIDKFVYIIINPTPMIESITAKYSITETVDHPNRLKHTRIRAAFLDLSILKGIEIGSYASIPSRTGLGSSSSFSVALMKALYSYLDKRATKKEIAEAACRLEIDLLNEPIGKQDQYAAAFGGFNVFKFNTDNTVDVRPILIDHKTQNKLEKHLLLFFTGITRDAGSVLKEQKDNIEKKFQTIKEMTELVPKFEKALIRGDIKKTADILHQNWLKKKSLSSKISNSLIDKLYEASLRNGAWGGKILGAGGGGCLMIFVSPDKRNKVLSSMSRIAKKNKMTGAREIPVKFTQSGVDTLFSIPR